jgi:hypothetical protein
VAQAWRRLADDSTDTKYQAVLYGCADDLCRLNPAKAPCSHSAKAPCSRLTNCARVRIEGKCTIDGCNVYDPVKVSDIAEKGSKV